MVALWQRAAGVPLTFGTGRVALSAHAQPAHVNSGWLKY